MKGLTHHQQLHSQRAELLDKTRWANEFEWEEVFALSEWMEMFAIPKGGVLFSEGEQSYFMCVLIEGEVSVLKRDSNNEEVSVAIVRNGYTLGEMALLENAPRSATVRATRNTRLLVLSRGSFEKMCEKRPALALKFIRHVSRMISQRLRRMSGALVEANMAALDNRLDE